MAITSTPNCEIENWSGKFFGPSCGLGPEFSLCNSENVSVVFSVLTSSDCDERWYGMYYPYISRKAMRPQGTRDGLKPPNSYLVGCEIFTAGQGFNSSWVLDMTSWLPLNRRPQSQDVVKNLQSAIWALIVLVGETELCADKKVNELCRTSECVTKGDYQGCLEKYLFVSASSIHFLQRTVMHLQSFLVSTFGSFAMFRCSLFWHNTLYTYIWNI